MSITNYGLYQNNIIVVFFSNKSTKAVSKKKQVEEQPKAKKAKVEKVEKEEVAEETKSSSSDSEDASGKTSAWNLKFASWNVNGIRAWLKKDSHQYITKEDADIFCVQETKCAKDQIPKQLEVDGYHTYWLSGDKDGYSGTGLYSKKKPLSVNYGIDVAKHDKEGRVITAEYDKFYFVTAYIPNSGRGLTRLDYRSKEWDPAFKNYIKTLDKKKPVIFCGDLNVAHQAIDLANPKSNFNKTAGYTQAEIDGFTDILKGGFIDSFRHLYPKKSAYSYWSYMRNSRANNIGWRLDYFVISERLKGNLCDSLIRSDVQGSDHCPIVLLMNI